MANNISVAVGESEMIASGCSVIVTDVPLFSIVTGKLAVAADGADSVDVAVVWPQAVSNNALTATTTWILLNMILLVWSKKYPTQHTQGVIQRTLPRELVSKTTFPGDLTCGS
jgi:hypothetical protein